MKINISSASVAPMRAALRKLKDGRLSRSELDRVLSHRDYAVEFARYNQPGLPVCGIMKGEYEDYLMGAMKKRREDVQNPRLRDRHDELRTFIANIDKMSDSFLSMFRLSGGDMARIQSDLEACFGPELMEKAGDITILLTVGIGNSFGWPYERYIHFDVVQLLSMVKKREELLVLIVHEMNHILMSMVYEAAPAHVSPLEEFILSFSYEGAAVKFSNNACGLLSQPLYGNRQVNTMLDAASWEHHGKEFPLALNRLHADIERIRRDGLTEPEAGGLLGDFWMRPDIQSLIDGAELRLQNYRNYYMGSEIFGAIYDCFGRDRFLEDIRKPSQIIPDFNEAARMKGHPELAVL